MGKRRLDILSPPYRLRYYKSPSQIDSTFPDNQQLEKYLKIPHATVEAAAFHSMREYFFHITRMFVVDRRNKIVAVAVKRRSSFYRARLQIVRVNIKYMYISNIRFLKLNPNTPIFEFCPDEGIVKLYFPNDKL